MLFFIGIILFIFSLVINILASWVSTRATKTLRKDPVMNAFEDQSQLARAAHRRSVSATLALFLSLLTVLPILGIVVYIITKALPASAGNSSPPCRPTVCVRAAFFPAIVGTVYLTLGQLLFRCTAGMAAGIYIAEYAKDTP